MDFADLTPGRSFVLNDFIRPLFPNVQALMEADTFTPRRLVDYHEGGLELTLDHALSLLGAELTRRVRGREQPLRVALAPAGGLLERAVSLDVFSSIQLVGAFDSQCSKETVRHGVRVLPMTRIATERPDIVVLLSKNFAISILDSIAEASGGSLPEVYCPFYDAHAPLPPALTSWAEGVNELAASGPTVAVVCLRFYAPYYKRFVALRQAGVRTVLLTLLDKMSHTIPLGRLGSAFDLVHGAGGDAVAFLRLLQAVRPHCAHVISLANSSSFPALIAAGLQVPFLIEYVDLLTSIHSLESLAGQVGRELAEQEFACERYVLERASGLVSKSSDEADERMFAVHGVRLPTLKFFTYPLAEPREAAVRDESGPMSFVSIGGVHGGGPSPVLSLDMDIRKTIGTLTAQGLRLHIYNAYDDGEDSAYDHLRALAREDAGFSYSPAVHPDVLIATINSYDAGWFVDDYSSYCYDNFFFHTSTSSRFFDYIEAGLPIVILRELRFMASLVEEHGLGYVIDYVDLPRLADIVTRSGLAECRERVAAFRGRHLMSRQIERLAHFYERYAAGEGGSQALGHSPD